MFRILKKHIWLVFSIVAICAVLLTFLIVARQATAIDTNGAYEALRQSIQETNSAVEKLIEATVAAKTQAAGK